MSIFNCSRTMPIPTEITFFERFETDICSGKKTITIRDESESHYQPGSVVQVTTLETRRPFGRLSIDSVTPVQFSELSELHAQQENMTLDELKAVIQAIYPGIEQLFVISFTLLR